MRTSLLKRIAAGFMAVATAATLVVGMSAATVTDATFATAGTFGGFTITGITVAGTALTTVSGNNDATAGTGVIAIPIPAGAIGRTITVTATITPDAGKYLSAASATEVGDADAGALGTSLINAVTNNYDAAAILAAQPKATTLSGLQTVTFTTTTKTLLAAPATAYIQLANTQATTETNAGFAFWTGGVVDRRIIPAANISGTTLTIKYDSTTDASLMKFTGDTLPTVTIGKAMTSTLTDASSSTYYTASINKAGTITLNSVTYTVAFVTEPIAQLNATTWDNATLKAKMAYTVAVDMGGATYTLNKDTAAANYTFVGTTLTFTKVTTGTGSGTVTFKGAYLYADQSFTLTAAELAAGKAFTLVYKDGATAAVTVRGTSTGVTATSIGINGTPPTAAVMIDGAASTKYPFSATPVAGMTTVAINLVNDIIPATLQVKLTSTFIAGGSKTVDVDFYNQVFPVELTDGSFYYLSVNVSSLKNTLLPVSKFDFIGVASSNINLNSLITWNKTNPDLNKILYVDYTGTLTDRVTYSGVLADGTTDKIFPTTSYYQPNATYDSAYWFYSRWSVGDTLFGSSVKFTRPYVTFDITDATTKEVVTYSVVFVNSKQEIYATAINSTLGGQASVTVATGEYSQPWSQANAATQFARGTAVKTPGQINITSFYTGTIDLTNDYVMLTIRLPKGATVSMATLDTGDIKSMDIVQSFAGTVGNTTVDGLVDYVLRFKYREIYTGSNTVGTSTLKVTYPMTKADGTSATATSFKEYKVVTTWTAKSYIAEKKVTMAGITVPSAIVAPEASSVASSVAASSTAASSTATSSAAASSSLPVNPNTGVPFNTLAYIVTIAASAIGGVSTMVLRRK